MLQKSSSLNITHLFINCPASFRCKKRSVEFQPKALASLGLICRQKKLAVRCPLIGNAFPDQQIALIGPLALPNIQRNVIALLPADSVPHLVGSCGISAQ